MLVSVGELGAVVSIVNVVRVVGEMFQAGSVAVALMVVLPSGSPTVGVNVQFPLASAIAVPMRVPSASVMVTVDPGSAVPVTVGVLSIVVLPLTGLVMLGAEGADVSTLNVVVTGPVVFPALSVSVTLMEFDPSGSAGDIAKL